MPGRPGPGGERLRGARRDRERALLASRMRLVWDRRGEESTSRAARRLKAQRPERSKQFYGVDHLAFAPKSSDSSTTFCVVSFQSLGSSWSELSLLPHRERKDLGSSPTARDTASPPPNGSLPPVLLIQRSSEPGEDRSVKLLYPGPRGPQVHARLSPGALMLGRWNTLQSAGGVLFAGFCSYLVADLRTELDLYSCFWKFSPSRAVEFLNQTSPGSPCIASFKGEFMVQVYKVCIGDSACSTGLEGFDFLF